MRYSVRSARCVALVLIGMVASLFNMAQAQHSNTIIGRESLAADCYDRSQSATLSRSASHDDIRVCNRAIIDGALIKSELAASYSNRGIIYMAMEDFSKAYQDYEKALKIDNELAEAYINRGNLWFAVEQYQRAIADYDSALEYGTDKVAITLLNRGLARENGGDLLGAKADYFSSLQVKPDWQPVLDKLDRVNLKLQKNTDE